MKLWKRVVVLGVAMSMAANALAFWALAAPAGTAIMWLGRAAASNVTMARAVEWSIYAHGAVLGFLAWKNNADTAAQTSSPVNARLVVQPNATAQRDNPDPTTWDSAASGARNPTPKSAYNLTTSSTYPAQNQPICNIVTNSLNTYFDAYSWASGAYKTTYFATTTNTNPGNGFVTGGSYTCSGTFYYLWQKSVAFTPTCPTGYALSGSGANTTCTLTAQPATVQKPVGKVPCEVVKNSNGTWDIDSQNPECVGLSSALTANNRTLTYNKGDGTYDTVTTNADGTTQINTGNRQISLGPQNTDGTYPITGITDNGANAGGTGGGTSGQTGTGSAVCGGPGLPACSVSIDDSGFSGKDTTVNAAADDAKAKLDDRTAFINSKANDSSTFGLDNTWIPSLIPGPAVACQAAKWEPGISHGPLASMSGSVDIDWCNKIDFIREYYAWLVGLVTVWAIALLFFSSNGNVGRSGGK